MTVTLASGPTSGGTPKYEDLTSFRSLNISFYSRIVQIVRKHVMLEGNVLGKSTTHIGFFLVFQIHVLKTLSRKTFNTFETAIFLAPSAEREVITKKYI